MSYPGLGVSTVAGGSRAHPPPGHRPRARLRWARDAPGPGWLDAVESRPGWRQRARDRRALSRARRLPGLRPRCARHRARIRVPTSHPWAPDPGGRRRVVRGPVPPRRPAGHAGSSGPRDRVPGAGGGGGGRAHHGRAPRKPRPVPVAGADPARCRGTSSAGCAPMPRETGSPVCTGPPWPAPGSWSCANSSSPRPAPCRCSWTCDPRPTPRDSVEETIARAAGLGAQRPATGRHRRAVHEHGRPRGDRLPTPRAGRRCCAPWRCVGPASAAPGRGPPLGGPAHRGGGVGDGQRAGRRRRPRDHRHRRGPAHPAGVARSARPRRSSSRECRPAPETVTPGAGDHAARPRDVAPESQIAPRTRRPPPSHPTSGSWPCPWRRAWARRA